MVLRWRVLSGFEKDEEYLYKHYDADIDYATARSEYNLWCFRIKVWLFKVRKFYLNRILLNKLENLYFFLLINLLC
jgi:hypothetical protein